jgi:hypothetical protein
MRFGPTSFSNDTELSQPISSLGPLTARGSLYATEVKVNGPCVIGENLEINTSLKVNGPLTINGMLTGIADANIKVNGPVKVQKGLLGGNVRINGPLKSGFLDVTSLNINGPLSVEEDVVAGEEISLGVGSGSRIRSDSYIEVGGLIEAPVVRISNYTSKISASGILKRIFGLEEKYIKTVVLEGLRIKAKLLELEGVVLENCDLDLVEEIVNIRDE